MLVQVDHAGRGGELTSLLRRRRLPEHLRPRDEALLEVVRDLARARRALTACVPSTRLPGRPLAEGLAEFEEILGAVIPRMHDWRSAEIEEEWGPPSPPSAGYGPSPEGGCAPPGEWGRMPSPGDVG